MSGFFSGAGAGAGTGAGAGAGVGAGAGASVFFSGAGAGAGIGAGAAGGGVGCSGFAGEAAGEGAAGAGATGAAAGFGASGLVGSEGPHETSPATATRAKYRERESMGIDDVDNDAEWKVNTGRLRTSTKTEGLKSRTCPGVAGEINRTARNEIFYQSGRGRISLSMTRPRTSY